MSRFEVANLVRIRAALDAHNSTCVLPARAILLNPIDHGLLGWPDLWGLPVLADADVPVKRVRIDCEASTLNIERELEEIADDVAGLDEDVA